MAPRECVEISVEKLDQGTKVTQFRRLFLQNFGTYLRRCFSSVSPPCANEKPRTTLRSQLRTQKLRAQNFASETSGRKLRATLRKPTCDRKAHESLACAAIPTYIPKGQQTDLEGKQNSPVIRCRLTAQAPQATVPGALHETSFAQFGMKETGNQLSAGSEHEQLLLLRRSMTSETMNNIFEYCFLCKIHSARNRP